MGGVERPSGNSRDRRLELRLLIFSWHCTAYDIGALPSLLCTVASRAWNQEGQGPVVMRVSWP